LRFIHALLFAVTIYAQPVHTLCQACHTEQVQDFLAHPHAAKALSCDACHGSSAKHREAQGGAPPDRVAGPQEVPALCGACHASQKPLFDKSKHAAVLALAGKVRAPSCSTCHGAHAQVTAAQTEARCIRCHTPLPATCKPGCNTCHDPHTLALRKK
jgi:hypothetical protein